MWDPHCRPSAHITQGGPTGAFLALSPATSQLVASRHGCQQVISNQKGWEIQPFIPLKVEFFTNTADLGKIVEQNKVDPCEFGTIPSCAETSHVFRFSCSSYVAICLCCMLHVSRKQLTNSHALGHIRCNIKRGACMESVVRQGKKRQTHSIQNHIPWMFRLTWTTPHACGRSRAFPMSQRDTIGPSCYRNASSSKQLSVQGSRDLSETLRGWEIWILSPCCLHTVIWVPLWQPDEVLRFIVCLLFESKKINSVINMAQAQDQTSHTFLSSWLIFEIMPIFTSMHAICERARHSCNSIPCLGSACAITDHICWYLSFSYTQQYANFFHDRFTLTWENTCMHTEVHSWEAL